MKNLVENCNKLGFGLMRLPRTGEDMYSPIDVETVKQMVDAFMEAGGKYFDTAFVYGGSEEAAKEALCDRYPRDSYYLATKINAAPFAVKTKEEALAQTATSLERTGAGYIDFYLLHGIGQDSYKVYEEWGLWEYVQDLKKQGLVKHVGFSYHDNAAFLDKVLTEHPETEFVQLQLNYADWEIGSVEAHACYDVCVKHDVPIVVMEPVKGGLLANPPAEVRQVFEALDPDASPSSWAIRFAASLPQVMMVLSGMSNMEQMEDNLSYMRDFKPLTPEETDAVMRAADALANMDVINCTMCHYCTPGCPVQIHIPEIFETVNDYRRYGDLQRAKNDYGFPPGSTKASECVKCGQCEGACPQHLPIISLLEQAVELFE